MFELDATADMLLMSQPAKASTETPATETRIEVVLVKAVLEGDRNSFGRLSSTEKRRRRSRARHLPARLQKTSYAA